LLASFGDALGDLLADIGGNRFAIYQLCGHCAWLTIEREKKGRAFSHGIKEGQRRENADLV